VLPRLASFEAWSDTGRRPRARPAGEVLRAWAKDYGVGAGSDVPLTVIVDRATKMQSGGGFDPTLSRRIPSSMPPFARQPARDQPTFLLHLT
jgi:hypothetical protein